MTSAGLKIAPLVLVREPDHASVSLPHSPFASVDAVVAGGGSGVAAERLGAATSTTYARSSLRRCWLRESRLDGYLR